VGTGDKSKEGQKKPAFPMESGKKNKKDQGMKREVVNKVWGRRAREPTAVTKTAKPEAAGERR